MDLVSTPKSLRKIDMRVRGRWLVNLFLLGFVLMLGVLVALRPGKHVEIKAPLLNLDMAALSAITLENGELIEFERKDGVWRLMKPFEAAVNQARVEQLLAITLIVPAADYPLPEVSALKGYGLSEPFAKLSLAGRRLDFGGTAPLDHRRYVITGERLYLVDDSFSHQLASKATDFVDKKLIPDAASIRKLSIPGLHLIRTAEGAWLSEPPLDQELLQDLVMQWSTARAIEVRKGAPKVLGEKIEIETSTGSIRFSILQKTPELILGREDLDLVFVMTTETSKALLNASTAPSHQGGERRPQETLHRGLDPEHQSHADE